MATIQVRNLDDEAYDVLRRRAGESGRSLQEYLRLQLEDLAKRPTLAEAFADVRRALTDEVSVADVVAAQRTDRDR
jgi:plasmid stability protein